MLTKVEPVLPSDELLEDPCSAVGAGDTVKALAQGYVSNTLCLYQYRDTLKAARDWKKDKQELYKKKEKE